VASLFNDDFLTALGMETHGDLVTHCAGGYKQGGFFSKDLGGPFLEAARSRVFSVDIITDFGARHRFPHLIGRFRDGIASQIDVAHGRGSSMTLFIAVEENSDKPSNAQAS